MIGIWTIVVVLIAVVIIFGYIYQKDRHDQQELQHYITGDETQDPGEIKEYESNSFAQGIANLQISEPAFIDLEHEMSTKIVGMQEFIHALFITILVHGHALVEGVPGLAKTRTISTLSQALDLSFKRIQFTPDMLPGDITGIEIYNAKTKAFDVTEGPIFANIVLADEINRTAPKVQSALLEAMQEQQVTIGGQTKTLPQPFFVLATQNPLEQEGTYPLPEAQVDRFLFHILVDYPTMSEERKILDIHESLDTHKVKKILTHRKLTMLQNQVTEITISTKLKEYIINLVAATREHPGLIKYGASPRASIALMQASRAVALLSGRKTVKKDDIQAVALLVLRHRVILRYETKAKGMNADDVLVRILSRVDSTK